MEGDSMEEKQQKERRKPLTPDNVLKYEIAAELGLMEKVERTGWKSLTAKESGRIGGLMTKRKRVLREQGFDIKDMQVEEINFDMK